MNHAPSAELPDAFTRLGPSFEALFEANQHLHAYAASPSVFNERYEQPPPSYHSRSRSHSLTLVEERPEAVDDDPAILRELEENARAIPLLWEQNKYQGWSTAQIQRDIDAWTELGRKVEQDKVEEKERLFKLLTSGSSYGLFEDHRANPEEESTDGLQMDKFMACKRKRRRTEVERLTDSVQTSAGLSTRSLPRLRSGGAGRDAPASPKNGNRNRIKVGARELPTTPRRSKRIVKVTAPEAIESSITQSASKPGPAASAKLPGKRLHSSAVGTKDSASTGQESQMKKARTGRKRPTRKRARYK